MALIATHLGIVNEDQINDMSLIFFEDVLVELGKKLNYDAVVNYAGNSFCGDSWKIIQDAYPMGEGKKEGTNSVAAFFERATVTIKGKNASPEAFGPIEGKRNKE